MKIDAVYGKIIALAKEYHFKEPPEWGFESQFPAGKRDPFSFGGIFLKWWITKRGVQLRDQLAKMIVAFEPQLDGDVASFAEMIDRALQQNVLDSRIFRADDILFFRATTLFELRACNERTFAELLWTAIREALMESVANWLVVVPMPRLRSTTVSLGYDGLTILASTDRTAWSKLTKNYAEAQIWDPLTGRRDEKDARVFGRFGAESWLVCEVRGTQLGANKIAKQSMRTLVALIFANLHPKPSVLLKSMAEVPVCSTQFPDNSSHVDCGQAILPIGTLMPPLLVDLDLTPAHIASIQEWYRRRDAASDEQRQRAVTASHFVHYAVLADDLERFIHFFITLDALFGVRDKVEATIVAGVDRTFANDASWSDRARLLFDLRSELLHGGSSSIEQWNGLEHYTTFYRSEPLDDVATLALTSLRKFFD